MSEQPYSDRTFMEKLCTEFQRSKKNSSYKMMLKLHYWLAGNFKEATEGLE